MIFKADGTELSYKLLNTLLDKTFMTCISKDETRQSIYQKVLHHSDLLQLVAVTGHIAFFSKSKYSIGSSDKVIDLEGMKISDIEFPSVKFIQYSPENCKMLEKVLIDLPKIKVTKNAPTAYLNRNAQGEHYFSLSKDDSTLLGVDSNFLINLAGLKIDISILKKEAEVRPIYFHFREGETYVVMPKKL